MDYKDLINLIIIIEKSKKFKCFIEKFIYLFHMKNSI
jgi:hypothetical protein